MMFLTMDDPCGLFEVTVFPDLYRSVRKSVGRYGPYVVTGRVQQQYGAISITAERLELVGHADEPFQDSAGRPVSETLRVHWNK